MQHKVRIGRTYAIASKLVTKAQFRSFQQATPDVRNMDYIEGSAAPTTAPRFLWTGTTPHAIAIGSAERRDSPGAMVL